MNRNSYYILLFHALFVKPAIPARNDVNRRLCANETNFDINSKRSRHRNENELLSTQEYKCYQRCINLKVGIINENGDLEFDKLMKKYNLKIRSLKLAKIMKCKSNSTNECEKAYDVLKCAEDVMHSALYERRLVKDDCMKTMSINRSDYEKAYNTENFEIYNSHKMKCYRRCILINKGLINEEGVPIFEVWNKTYPLSVHNQKYIDAKTCSSTAKDSCEKSEEIRECILSKLDQSYNNTKWSKECRFENHIEQNSNQCYLRCMCLKMGYIKTNGEPHLMKIINNLGILENSTYVEAARDCNSISTDLCLKSNEIFNCIYETLNRRFVSVG